MATTISVFLAKSWLKTALKDYGGTFNRGMEEIDKG
jgi:hypothetical protein